MVTENQLIDGLKNKNEEAFVRLMEIYGTRLLKTCYLILRDREEAEDIVQETFIRVYKNIGAFKGDSSLYTWIYKIALNLSRDRLKKKDCKLQIEEDLLGLEDLELRVEDRLIRERIFEEVKGLDPIYRQALILFYYEDMSISEISNISGEKQGTIKSRLSRARNILKVKLERGGVKGERG